jgi:hypothetical protein
MRLPPGTLVPGYTLLEELGRGGMGVVYKARQAGLNRTVAIKLLATSGGPAAKRLQSRFRSEAEAIAKLHHPGIVQIHEIGAVEGTLFYSMEYLEAGSLASQLAKNPLHYTPRQAAALVESLARAVQVAHAQGIIHRDLKPANVLLTPEGHPKITDFGLAKRLDNLDGETIHGTVLGTPGYMSPEQAQGRGDAIGPASDIFSLGVILYELLAGKRFCDGQSLDELLNQVSHDDLRLPAAQRHKIPKDLITICLTCLRAEPEKRYGSATALADDLRRFLEDQPIAARRLSLVERGRKWVRHHPGWAWTLSILLILLSAGSAGATWYWRTYVHVHEAYYQAVVRRWGIWQGVGPLSAATARQRACTFVVRTRGGRVESVDFVNGSGFGTGNHPLRILLDGLDGPTGGTSINRIELGYNDRGQVREERLLDRTGRVVWIFHYTTDRMGHFMDPSGLPRARSTSGAAFVQFTRDDRGFEREVRFFDAAGVARPATDGTYGIRNEVEERGLRIASTCLGPNDLPTTHRHGFSQIRQEYDPLARRKAISYWQVDGRPARYRGTYHRVTFEHDALGNEVEATYLDENLRPTPHPRGYVQVRHEYDDRGNQVVTRYYTAPDQAGPDVDGVTEIVRDFDEQGQCYRMRFFGNEGQPVQDVRGVHGLEIILNRRGLVASESYLGFDLKPCTTIFGYGRVEYRYNDTNDCLDAEYFDSRGERIPMRPRITLLNPHGELAKAGVQVGDVVLESDGTRITSRCHLLEQCRLTNVATPSRLTIRRHQETLTLSVPLAALPGEVEMTDVPRDSPR